MHPDIFGTVVATESVSIEFSRLVATDPRFLELKFPNFLEILNFNEIHRNLIGNHKLHRGEIDSISLAGELDADALLIDERAGRSAAADLGLRCVGILGILLQAKTQGLIGDVGSRLDRLRDEAGFWISPSLLRKILEVAGE